MKNDTKSHIKKFLDDGEDCNFVDEMYGTTLLMSAVFAKDIESMERLLEAGVDINIQDNEGETALMKACSRGDLNVVKILIAYGADVNLQDNEGYTALALALDNHSILKKGFTKEHQEIISVLVQNSANINLNPKGEISVLTVACILGNFETVQLLIEYGADVNAKDERGVRPMFGAIMPIHSMPEFSNIPVNIDDNKQRIIELLIKNGADVNATINGDTNALLLACVFGNIEIIESLIEFGADVNTGSTDDMNILAMVLLMSKKMFKLISSQFTTNIDVLFSNFEEKREDIARLLIRNGADVNYGTSDMNLLMACTINKIKMLEGVEGTIEEKETQRVFINSMNFGDIEVAKFLIENGADINIQDNQGVTSLMYACLMNNIEMAELLISNGADVNISDNMGSNAYSLGKKHKDIIRLLLNNGVDLKTYVKNGTTEELEKNISKTKNEVKNLWAQKKTPMTEVLRSRDIEKLRELIDSGYDTSFVDLFDLIKEDYSVDFIHIIIKNGRNINIAHKKADITPLMLATLLNKIEIVKLLVTYGADVELKAKDGKEAYDFAKNPEIIQILLNPLDYQTNFHRPKELVKILTNFTKDTPIKYTTHIWDFGDIKKEYGDFQGFMEAVYEQWRGIEQELGQLSSNLHDKIYSFLLNKSNDDSWCSKADITLGWSSLEGLKEWCDSGNDPFDFKLPKPILLDRKTELTTFGQVIELFKQEIEIRRDYNNLSNIVASTGEKLGNDFTLTAQKLQRQFYTDVEKFTLTLDKIFDGIKKYNDYKHIEVTAHESEGGTIELRITQIDSPSTLNAKDLFAEAEDGDFEDIKANLTNLCDWSVEGCFEENSFRINYLKSNNVKDMVELDCKPVGFTHILRFYKR